MVARRALAVLEIRVHGVAAVDTQTLTRPHITEVLAFSAVEAEVPRRGVRVYMVVKAAQPTKPDMYPEVEVAVEPMVQMERQL